MKKGAALSTLISLPGRYIVLMPGSSVHSISRKIEKEKERTRLKAIMKEIKIPEGIGIIIRTAAKNIAKTNILKDVKTLLKIWEDIKKKAEATHSTTILHKTDELIIRTLRDYLTNDVDEILIDNPEVFEKLKKFLKVVNPKSLKILKRYRGKKPIFSKYEIEKQLASIFENRVSLKSGGSIVIDTTEALVAIDVNSGKATQKKSIEETAKLTNIEAASEIAKQLKLRDLGGLIVIDFIDMREQKNRTKIEKVLKDSFKRDKAKLKFMKISKFGLLEMSRQRLKPSYEANLVQCKYCKGKGLLHSTETFSLNFLRKINLKTIKLSGQKIKIVLPSEIAFFILNKKKQEILNLERQHNIQINIESDPYMMPYESKILVEDKITSSKQI